MITKINMKIEPQPVTKRMFLLLDKQNLTNKINSLDIQIRNHKILLKKKEKLLEKFKTSKKKYNLQIKLIDEKLKRI